MNLETDIKRNDYLAIELVSGVKLMKSALTLLGLWMFLYWTFSSLGAMNGVISLFIAALGLVAIPYCGAAVVLIGYSLTSHLTKTYPAGVLGHHSFTVSPEGFIEETEVNHTFTAWCEVQRMSMVSDYIVIAVADWKGHILPLRSFESRQAFEEFFSVAKKYLDEAKADGTLSKDYEEDED